MSKAKKTAANLAPLPEPETKPADQAALDAIIEKIKAAADQTNLSIAAVCECIVEPVLEFGVVYEFGGYREKDAEGAWRGEALLMNEEGGCVLRSGYLGQIMSLRESAQWYAGKLAAGQTDHSGEHPAQVDWHRRIAERMSGEM